MRGRSATRVALGDGFRSTTDLLVKVLDQEGVVGRLEPGRVGVLGRGRGRGRGRPPDAGALGKSHALV